MNIRLFLFPLLLVFGLLFVSCSSTSESPYVEIQTTEGTFVVQLYKETPLHRDHFLSLVKEGFYDELLFHRVERGYLMQAGDPNSRNASHNRILGTDNGGETIPAEIDTTLSRQEQSSERLNRKGALTAARLPDEVNPSRSSHSSLFYIIVGHPYTQTELDSLEHAYSDGRLDIIWQKLIMANRGRIDRYARRSDSTRLLQHLQDSLTSVASSLLAKESLLHFSRQQRKAYTTDGGVPQLDGEYTVFGHVVFGMDVIERIDKVHVDIAGRPLPDVKILHAQVLSDKELKERYGLSGR
ncbi:MAG: peptidylprolyl isomerase [Paludibacteraceae bacterium]|nr:peptidylprolyl isomerase [Paludibacteraceae bacterium]